MASKSQKSNPSSKRSGNRRKLVILLTLAVVAAVILVDISPLGGNIRYYAKWSSCGRQPVVANPGINYRNSVQYYGKEPAFTLMRSNKVLCSPLEAELHGYSASPDRYDFPEVEKKYGSWCREPGDPTSETAYKFDLCK